MLRRLVVGIVLLVLASAGAARAETDLAYVAPTLAACALDDLSMESRSAALQAVGWQSETNPETVFQRFLSHLLWGNLPNPTNETVTIAAAIAEAEDSLVNAYMQGLKDPAWAKAFLRRDDQTAALILYRFGDDDPVSARSSCDIITGALDRTLLDTAGIAERPFGLTAQKRLYQKGAVVGDRIMATETLLSISPPDVLAGSITLRAWTRLYTTTTTYDPVFLDALMADAE